MTTAVEEMALEQVAQRCAQETERFFANDEPDNRFCFELFRRAFAQGDQSAWERIYSQYESLVQGWVHDNNQFQLSGEPAEYFVNGVFSSMWRSCTPERFARFQNLPSALAYLKSCVHTVIYNHLRKKRPQADLDLDEIGERIGDAGTQSAVLDRIARAELWRLLSDLLVNDEERIVTECYFMQGMKPREILAQYPHQFENIRKVYRVKQNLLERLGRNAALKAFYQNYT